MERHDIQAHWDDPANNGGFGGKPVLAPASPDTEDVTSDEPKEEVNERPANPRSKR